MELVFFFLFLGSLLFGTAGSIEIYPAVTVYVHDLFLLIYLCITYKTWKPPAFSKEFLVFIGFAFFSLLLQIQSLTLGELSTSFLYLIRYVFYFLLAFTRIKLHNGLYVYGVVFAAVGLLQFVLYPDLRNLMYLGWDPHYRRLFSTLLDPNFTGIILVLAAILAVSKKYYVSALVICIALLLTFSRSSYLALLAGMAFLLIGQKRLLFLLLGVFVVALVFLPNKTLEGQNLARTASVYARLGNMSQGLALFGQKPIFGWGFNTLRYTNCQSSCVVSNAGAGIDNSFIFVLATTGIVGFAAYLWFLRAVWKSSGSVARASLVAVLVHSMFTNSQFYPWVLLWVWLLV